MITNWSMIISNSLTAIMAIFTAWMAWESRMTRRQNENPQIDIFIDRGEDFNGKLYLIIKNNGLGGAYNIKLSIDNDIKWDDVPERLQKLSEQGPFKNGIPFLPPNSERKLLLGIFTGEGFHQLLKHKATIRVQYKDVYRYTIKENNFDLSFTELENTFLLPENPLFTIANRLEKLEKNIHNITTRFSKIHVINQIEKERGKL